MSKIGSFAGVSFIVSTKTVRTPGDIKRDASARWSTHDRRLAKPLAEFQGPGQESLSYQIILKRSLGESPYQTMTKLKKFEKSGRVSAFMIGKKMIAGSHFYIESISETYKHINGQGVINTITADITLKEYPLTKKKKKKATSKSTKKKKTKVRSKAKKTGQISIKTTALNCRSSPSLKGKVVKVLKKNESYTVYGIKKTDISWYNLGSGRFCSANSKYVKFKKA